MTVPKTKYIYTVCNKREYNFNGKIYDHSQFIYDLNNGYRVSVVRELRLIGITRQPNGIDWEVAVLNDWPYDIMRNISDAEVEKYLDRISKLPNKNPKEDSDEINLRKVI